MKSNFICSVYFQAFIVLLMCFNWMTAFEWKSIIPGISEYCLPYLSNVLGISLTIYDFPGQNAMKGG